MRRGRRRSRTDASGFSSLSQGNQPLGSASGASASAATSAALASSRLDSAGHATAGSALPASGSHTGAIAPRTVAVRTVAGAQGTGLNSGPDGPAAADAADSLSDDVAGTSSEDDIAPYILPDESSTDGDTEAAADRLIPAEAEEEVAAGGAGHQGVAAAGPIVAAAADSSSGGALPPCSLIFCDAEDLYGYLLLRGAKQVTEEMYEVVRAGFNASSHVPLPSLSQVRRSHAPAVSKWMLPLSTTQVPSADGHGTVGVKFILPSAHVRRDISFAATHELFYAAEQRSSDDRLLHPEFIDSPFFYDRATHLLSGSTVRQFVLDGASISVGDTIDVMVAAPLPRPRVVVEDAHFCSFHSGVDNNGDLHAGDFVVLGAGEHSGTLVARHWLSSEFPVLSWMPDADDSVTLDVQGVSVFAAAVSTEAAMDAAPEPVGDATPAPAAALAFASGAFGASPPRRVSSGVKDGERFLVVSFCVYSDDIEVRRGRGASLGGVYLSYLTWQYEDRRSSGGSRTIAATPPGVDSDHVLRAITSDLVEGATEGWLCRAPDGSPVRVYADISMFLGDYLQVTKTSMMMGYSAKSPCPLCDYRVPGVAGSQFAQLGSSSDVEMARTSPRTTSVCAAVSVSFSQLT